MGKYDFEYRETFVKIKKFFVIGIPGNYYGIMEYGSRRRFFDQWARDTGVFIKYFDADISPQANQEVLKQLLIKDLSEFKPDTIFIYSNSPITLFDVLTEHKKDAKVAFWHCDWPHLRERWGRYYKKNSPVDFLFVVSAGHVDMYKNDLGILVSYLPNEFSNDFDNTVFDEKFYSDVAFVGQCASWVCEKFYDNRKKFIQYLISKNCQLRIFPDMSDVSEQDYWSEYNRRLWTNQTHHLGKMYGSGKIFLGVHTKSIDDTFCYFSNRPFITMGYGRFYLCWKTFGIENMFEIGTHLDVFSSFEEGFDKITFYLKNEDKREKIAKNAKKLIFEKHLSKYRCQDLISTIENEKPIFSGWLK
jgi:spore maturation protein CgeB